MSSKKQTFPKRSLKVSNQTQTNNSKLSSMIIIFFSIFLILLSYQFNAVIFGIFIGLPFIILGINRLIKSF